MSALLELTQVWWGWIYPVSLQLVPLTLVILAFERLSGSRVWPQLHTSLWLLLLLKVCLPPSWSISGWLWPVESEVRWLGEVTAAAAVAAQPPELSAGVQATLFWIWLSGALSLLVADHCIRRRARHALADLPRQEPSRIARSALEQAACRLGLKSAPELRVLHGLASPLVFGLRRPVICLPAALVARATRRQLLHVLLHECAHVRRHDAILSCAARCLQSLFWFHPCVWLAQRRLTVLREVACDQRAASALAGGIREYRRTLLSLARSLLDRDRGLDRRTTPGLAFMHRHGQIMARLIWLDRGPRESRWLRRLSTGLACIGLFACMPAPRSAEILRPDMPALEELEGCLRKRFALMYMQSQWATADNSR